MSHSHKNCHSNINGHSHHSKDGNLSNITLAFLLNLVFSVIEFFGGLYTGSTAILSDAIHDFSDSISLLLSYIAEKISRKKPTSTYTYGYKRITLISAFINIVVLSIGTFFVIVRATSALLNPNDLKTTEMIFISILGIVVNLISVIRLNGSKKILDKTVRLHLLEDLLGWISVFLTSIIIHFTNLYILDPLLSLIISSIVVYNIIKRLVEVYKIVMQVVPDEDLCNKIRNTVLEIETVESIENLHMWTLDGEEIVLTATLYLSIFDNYTLEKVKCLLEELGIHNSTIETKFHT